VLAELHVAAVAIQSEYHAGEVDCIGEARFTGYSKTNDVLPGEVVPATARTKDSNAVNHERELLGNKL
jgi:hypothetical protein